MSPLARSRPEGISTSCTPSTQEMRPGLPGSSFGLRAPSSSGGSQPTSNSAPPSINASARFSFTIKLGFASTKCGSSVGLASVVTSTRSPPTSFASVPKSGVVATTFNFACAKPGTRHNERAINQRQQWNCVFMVLESVKCSACLANLKLMRTVGAEQEFKLHPDGMRVPEQLPMIVIVLQPDLRKFARVKSQVRRDARAIIAKNIQGIESSVVAGHVLAPQAGDPTLSAPPEHLRIESPVQLRSW